jgi:hypothetical protein
VSERRTHQEERPLDSHDLVDSLVLELLSNAAEKADTDAPPAPAPPAPAPPVVVSSASAPPVLLVPSAPAPPPARSAHGIEEMPFFHKVHLWPLFVGIIVVFLVLTGGLTTFNRWLLAAQAEERAAVQREGNGYLDESIALIQEADRVIVELDKANESPIAEADIPRLEALFDQRESAQGSLDAAIAKAQQAEGTFLETGRQELARHAQDAANYRKQMLETSSQLIVYDIAAVKSALELEQGWALIVEAAADMRSAADVMARGEESAVTESHDYNQGALDKLAKARDALTAAAGLFPEMDLQVLREYLETKAASAELALASDEAFLAGDYDIAYAKNEEFVAKDAEVVKIAAGIPADPLNIVVEAYESATVQLREDYKTARSQAADADVYIRAYLGVDVQGF